MRRGPKPAKSKEAKPPVARRSPKDDATRVGDLEKRLAEALQRETEGLKREAEALEQQTATAEILRVISRSSTDVQPVFDGIIANAVRLCGAVYGIVWRFEGDVTDFVSTHNVQAEELEELRRRFPRRTDVDAEHIHTLVRSGTVLTVPDIETYEHVTPEQRARWRTRGVRSLLVVPMRRDHEVIGAIGVSHRDVDAFQAGRVQLLKTFADQAVIAIENVRLFNETKEALEQQTATSEILRVIAASPTDVQPVFDTIVESAARLCHAQFCHVLRFDGTLLHVAAHHGMSPEGVAALQSVYPLAPGRGSAAGRSILSGRIEQIPDTNADADFRHSRTAAIIGAQSIVAVPMLRDGMPIGSIVAGQSNTGVLPERLITLLQTFADQAVIAIENVRLFTELQEKNEALTKAHAQVTESLEQQTATAEILRVISSSPTDVQPVFEAIVRSASLLCDGEAALATRFDGELIHLAAQYNLRPGTEDVLPRLFPRRPGREMAAGRAIMTGAIVHIPDAQTDPDYDPEVARPQGLRSVLVVPMLREGKPIGSFGVSRARPGAFSDSQIELLKTFADQAVIAIENVRLFTELQEKNRALTTAHAQVTEALERQTATSEILRVISSSPTDVNPVFRTILANANRLCDASFSVLWLWDGEAPTAVAHENVSPAMAKALRTARPLPNRRNPLGLSILEQTVVHIADVPTDPRFTPEDVPSYRLEGARSILLVPMVREGSLVGVINIWRRESRAFTDAQIDLLKTFADQAVIAIENVRLFKELEERNRDLTTALDTQTATSDILRVISRSQTDVQPVFDAIVASAVRLLGAYSGALTRIVGEQIELAAITSTSEVGDAFLRARFPQTLSSAGPHARTIRDRAPLNIAETHTDLRLPETVRANARVRGYRSQAVVPLLRHNEAIGTISVTRVEPGGFTNDEIALLQTFADQAVIAIENARLLTELQERTQELTRSVEQLTALGDVGRAVSSSLDLETVLNTIVARAVQLAGAHSGTIWEYDAAAEEFVLRITQNVEDPELRANSNARVRRGEGAVGRLAISQRPVQIPDITDEGAYEGRLRDSLVGAGTRALLAIPLLHEDQLLGGLVISRRTPGEFPSAVVDLLASFATQSALALQNARLFLEIEDKSRQLEAASQHKSEFLANMSHELRTPLNAIIGFSEVLSEKMFGELNEKQEEYSKDIHASGQHLLSLINDILDLSKIEAGRMELELSDFHLPTALDNALTLVRERAGRRGIALQMNVDNRLGQIQADERKVRQVVLNLLSNGIKFTPEGGRIEVRATPQDGLVEVSVSDTGVGIAPEDQEAVFEEFRQVGTADKKVEGTGLGLTLCRKFVELHGGKIWVTSQVGMGSTFTFTIPVRPGE